MKTLHEAIEWVCEELEASPIFYGHGVDNPWDEAVLLTLYAAGVKILPEEEIEDFVLNPDQVFKIKKLSQERIETRIPLAYLTHQAFFAGLEFYVNSHVIIPRSPIAELIETNFEVCSEGGSEEDKNFVDISKINHVLDLCCGSGCIGIAMALYFDYLKIDLVDISEDALEVAKINIKKYNLEDRVNLIHSDLFENIKPSQKYDLILCNPPYVNHLDFISMPEEFSHEPELALISGDDGLDLTRKILSQAANYLSDNGVLILEVGNSAAALEEAYPEVNFEWIEFERGGVGVCLLRPKQLSLMLGSAST